MKVKGPMFSLEASGTVGGVITASRWKGRPYFRTTVTPSNPRSPGQTSTRAMFAFLGQAWAGLAALDQASWEELAGQSAVSPFNAYQSVNMRRWTQADYPSQDYPAAVTASPATIDDITVTGGVRQLTAAVQLGNVTDNWGVALRMRGNDSIPSTKADTVLVREATSAGLLTLVITPVLPGEWFISAQTFSADGNMGVESSDISGNAT